MRFVDTNVLLYAASTADDERRAGSVKRMSGVLWDTFTGSAPYRDILLRTMHPGFPVALAWNVLAGGRPIGGSPTGAESRHEQ